MPLEICNSRLANYCSHMHHSGRISASGTIDQSQLRQLVALAPSYLVLDSTTYPTTAEGVAEWSQGMNRICDGTSFQLKLMSGACHGRCEHSTKRLSVVVALHRKLALELETLNEVSRSCAESWVVCGSWRGLDSGRTAIQRVAARLKENVLGKTRPFACSFAFEPWLTARPFPFKILMESNIRGRPSTHLESLCHTLAFII